MIPLPLVNHRVGRAAVTCEYRCGDACFHEVPNTSDNPYFGDLVRRRTALQAGAVIAAAATVSIPATAAAAPDAAAAPESQGRAPRGLDFKPVEVNTKDEVVVPEGYEQGIVIRWGDPLFPGVPEFDFDDQTAAKQEKQFGFNCDFAAILPLDPLELSGIMVTNHEYTSEPFMFRGYDP